MRRLLVGGGVALLLGCAGLGEALVENITGEEITIREDGMDMTLPNGGSARLDWGDAARHDPSIPLSPPPGGEIGLSGEVLFPDAPDSHFVVYAVASGTQEALVARYRAELEGRGLTVTEEQKDGATQLEARDGDLTYIVAVSAEKPGELSVTLGAGSKEAIEQGLEAGPG